MGEKACELLEQVSHLKQQAVSSESSSASFVKQLRELQQQFHQLQGMVDRRQADTSTSAMNTDSETMVKEMWEKVAELHARLLEVEGGLDFARENNEVGSSHICEMLAVTQ